MDCPNCYTKNLPARLIRCPRCDWLLVADPPSGSSASHPTPPISNPWAESREPALPVMPAAPSLEEQTRDMWRARPEEQLRLPDPLELGLRQTIRLTGMQRGWLAVMALAQLAPLAVIVFTPFLSLLRSILFDEPFPAWIGLLLAGIIVLLLLFSLFQGVQTLIDAIEGEALQVIDQITRVAARVQARSWGRGRRRYWVYLADHGRLALGPRCPLPRAGSERYRVTFSPRAKIIWSLEPVHEGGSRSRPPA
ncbi:MAG: hypothetical protein KatS3mg057_3161 [Herpetosiphonaceae bacterium]|nr:MAG: hypothetical protein KatS3mg057_3161 [Herpetosiphonaceae bacterium]